MKQTAVEWLVDYIKHLEIYPYKTIKELQQLAKEIEKQQIIDSHCNGQGTVIILDEAEEYYNETFNLSPQDKP